MTHALIATHIHSYLSLTLLFPFVLFIARAHLMTHTTPNGPFTTPIVTHLSAVVVPVVNFSLIKSIPGCYTQADKHIGWNAHPVH